MRSGVHAPTYRSWQMMKNRTQNPRATDYARYGGRGIVMCPMWASFDVFLADMGQRPDGTTLERKDSNGPYTKTNCCWASRLVQSRNRDYTLNLTHNGETRKVWEWAQKLGVRPMTIHHRLWEFNNGALPLEKVFAENSRKKG